MKLTELEEELTVCYNCGENLNTIIDGCHGDFEKPIAEIYFSPGCPDTYSEPGEPDTIYIECRKCKETKINSTKKME